jgi:hypothetical protein
MDRRIPKVTWRSRVRRISIILTLFGLGLVEAHQLPRYGIEWLLGGILATVILASFWIRLGELFCVKNPICN